MTIVFIDICDFSKKIPHLAHNELHDLLEFYFGKIAFIFENHNLSLIKTIGDSLLFVSNIDRVQSDSCQAIIASLETRNFLMNNSSLFGNKWEFKYGINTGEAIAGIIKSIRRPMFDVWGTSINIASRLCDHSHENQINTSEQIYKENIHFFDFEFIGKKNLKNLGKQKMYCVKKIKLFLSEDNNGFMPNKNFENLRLNIKNLNYKYYELEKDIYNILTVKIDKQYTYHTLEHTKYVVKMAERIAFYENIFDHNIILIKTAALIHDIGYIFTATNNELYAVDWCNQNLRNYNYKEKDIDFIISLIKSTNSKVSPQNKYQEIIKDADLDYLGRTFFEDVSYMLLKEMKNLNQIKNDIEFYELQYDFLNNHKFYRKFAKDYRLDEFNNNKLKAKILLENSKKKE